MNSKFSKKIRKSARNSFMLFLRERPKYLPVFLWRISAILIFNKEGLKIVGGFYKLLDSVEINGKHYRIKKI